MKVNIQLPNKKWRSLQTSNPNFWKWMDALHDTEKWLIKAYNIPLELASVNYFEAAKAIAARDF